MSIRHSRLPNVLYGAHISRTWDNIFMGTYCPFPNLSSPHVPFDLPGVSMTLQTWVHDSFILVNDPVFDSGHGHSIWQQHFSLFFRFLAHVLLSLHRARGSKDWPRSRVHESNESSKMKYLVRTRTVLTLKTRLKVGLGRTWKLLLEDSSLDEMDKPAAFGTRVVCSISITKPAPRARALTRARQDACHNQFPARLSG